MPGKHKEIDIQIPHVDRNVGHALRSVTDEDGAGLVGQAGEGPDVVLGPQNIGDLCH